MKRKKGNQKSLDQRYQEVHGKILEGPGRELQELIDSGDAWDDHNREAMDALAEGSAVLPPKQASSYYGAPIPSYKDVEPGSTGSVGRAEKYQKEAGREHRDGMN